MRAETEILIFGNSVVWHWEAAHLLEEDSSEIINVWSPGHLIRELSTAPSPASTLTNRTCKVHPSFIIKLQKLAIAMLQKKMQVSRLK